MARRHIAMVPSAKNGRAADQGRAAAGQAQMRTLLLALACFLIGLAVSALLIKRSSPSAQSSAGAALAGTAELSETTRAVLQGLDKPIEIKFYSLLDSSALPQSVPTFVERVGRLLSAYEAAGNGKLKITRITSQSYANANAAVADGVKGFNLPNGDTCFLGLALSRGTCKDAVPTLAPEWEAAVEPDLTRALLRVVEATPSTAPLSQSPPPTLAALEAVKRSVPNLDSLSEQDATRIVRENALTEFAQATKEMEVAMKEAQGRLDLAQKSQSSADQQTAMKQLQQLQAEQTEKLRQIAANTQAQIQALQQYKSSAH